MSGIIERSPNLTTPVKQGRGTGNSDVRSNTKKIIFNVYGFLKNLAEHPEKISTLNFNKTQVLTAEMCGVSRWTVQRVCEEASQFSEPSPKFDSPRKSIKRKRPATELDDFDKDFLRRSVHEFYDRGEYPTSSKIRKIMEEKTGYVGSQTSILRVMKKLGFKYTKGNDGRKFLMERRDIVAARADFLRKMHDLRASADTRPIYYLDETWVNKNHSLSHTWQDSTRSGGMKIPVGKGGRLIVCHAGSDRTGFIPESKLVFRAKSKSADYHTEMNSELFRDWFVNDFINYLEEGSIIVLDNASYHSVQLNKIPSSNSRKAEILAWLANNNITADPSNTVAQLLRLVEPYKTSKKLYEIDAIANEHGHEVIRLPPYHCQYNPIELIWAQVKRHVAEKNNTFRLADVEKLMHEALDKVTVSDWGKCVQHAVKLQEEDFTKECARDSIIEPIIINLRDSDCESDLDSCESEDEME